MSMDPDRRHLRPDLAERVMRMSSSLVAPSAVAILSTALLCGLGGPAMSQTTPSSSSSLPSVTVQAPSQVARPPHKPLQSANTGVGRRAAPAARTSARRSLGRHRLRRVRSWRSLPSSREPAAIAPMVAKQVSSTATNPGMAAPGRGLNLVSRIRAETSATTKPTMNARTPLSFWVGETVTPGGIAAACSQGGSWPGRRFRSPNSGDQDIGNSPGFGRTSYENVIKPCRALSCRYSVNRVAG